MKFKINITRFNIMAIPHNSKGTHAPSDFLSGKPKAQGILDVFPSILGHTDGKDASRHTIKASAVNCAVLPYIFYLYILITSFIEKYER